MTLDRGKRQRNKDSQRLRYRGKNRLTDEKPDRKTNKQTNIQLGKVGIF